MRFEQVVVLLILDQPHQQSGGSAVRADDEFAENGVGSKPSLAIEILMNSDSTGEEEFSNWSIPSYIQEGLIWLRKD